MTAEIAILNQSAVALAADSAVTIGRGERTFETGNKLFTLSKYAPVGVMFYNNTTLMDLPWETIIKLFRRDLGEKRFRTLSEYADALLDFLRAHVSWFPDQHQRRIVTRTAWTVFGATAGNVDQTLAERIRTQGSISSSDLAALTNAAQSMEGYLSGLARLGSLSSGFEVNFANRYAQIIQQARLDVFGTATLGQTLEALLDRLVMLRFTQEFFGFDDQSGLVVAGYGDGDLFPSLRQFTLEYVVADEVRVVTGVPFSIDYEATAFVLPFAQTEEMWSFVFGFGSNLSQTAGSLVKDRLIELTTELQQVIPALTAAQQQALQAHVQAAIQQHVQRFGQDLFKYGQEQYLAPIQRAVRVLPKEDLAAMAEALVSLASLRRKTSIDVQSVGGPIDVAVISKGDGFVWIRRKHYFEPALNPQFFANYYR